ncbi:hypothetical protein GCM10022223_28290 [Kineosporia mesophila]|uniref:Uncharacterized protein n=1 Tax=Kineosporia mesophila TaxID=566012 RepID=A0ABP6ZL42_9ACTN
MLPVTRHRPWWDPSRRLGRETPPVSDGVKPPPCVTRWVRAPAQGGVTRADALPGPAIPTPSSGKTAVAGMEPNNLRHKKQNPDALAAPAATATRPTTAFVRGQAVINRRAGR